MYIVPKISLSRSLFLSLSRALSLSLSRARALSLSHSLSLSLCIDLRGVSAKHTGKRRKAASICYV